MQGLYKAVDLTEMDARCRKPGGSNSSWLNEEGSEERWNNENMETKGDRSHVGSAILGRCILQRLITC